MLDVGATHDVPKLMPAWSRDFADPIAALVPSPDGSSLAVAFVEGTVRVLDAGDGCERWSRAMHDGGATAISWNASGTTLASAGHDGYARGWDAANGTSVADMRCGSPWVTRVSFEPNGDRLATAAGREIALWQADGTLVTR